MVFNREGTTFSYDGKQYTIGGRIKANDQSEYEGLAGRITEIRTGDDRETENDEPDIYCAFDPPDCPSDITKLEERFSALYLMPKTLDEIILDMVIMSPDMIEQI